MSEKPVVSIIIPSYNYANYIEETLICLQRQKLQNWEAIVVDDGSIDNTREVVQNFLNDNRILYIHQENKGLPAARNVGINLSKGDYIQFLDADDLISEDKLLKQVDFMNDNPVIDISYTQSFYFTNNNKTKLFLDIKLGDKEWIPKLNDKGFDILKILIRKNIMPVNSALIKKKVFSIVGFQDELLKSFEDWEFWINCAINGQFFSFLEDKSAFALIRVHSDSMSQNRLRMSNCEIVLRESIDTLIKKSNLPINQKNELLELNNKKKEDNCRSFIIKDGLLDWSKWKFIYNKFGIKSLFRIYFKALNDLRKTNIHSKRIILCLFVKSLHFY